MKPEVFKVGGGSPQMGNEQFQESLSEWKLESEKCDQKELTENNHLKLH